MPLWLERLLIEHPVLIWGPIAACVAGAAALWLRQSRRSGRGSTKPVRVGMAGGLAAVVALIGLLAGAVYVLGLWADLWAFICERPTLVGWWIAAVGGALMLWGVLAHSWRGEARLSRQCRGCGYDMGPLTGQLRCPECGRQARSERALRPVNVRRRAVAAGLLVMLLAWSTPRIVATIQRGWAAALPDLGLTWWMGKTATAPDRVVMEAAYRATRDAGDGRPTIGVWDADELGARLLEADAVSLQSYAHVLSGNPVSQQTWGAAMAQSCNDADSQRRLNALTLLCVVEGEGEIDVRVLRTWTDDVSNPVRIKANEFVHTTTWRLRNRLIETVREKRTPSDADVLALLRITTYAGALEGYFGPGIEMEAFVDHADPEIAARASLVADGYGLYTHPMPRVRLMRLVRAQHWLREQKMQPWSSVGWYWLDNAHGASPSFRSLQWPITSPDPQERAVFYSLLGPEAATMRSFSWSTVQRRVGDGLEILRERLKTEDDPHARAMLSGVLEAWKTPPSGQTP